MNLGAHVSIAQSIDLAVDRAKALGCDGFQIFPSPPRSWSAPRYPTEKIEQFIRKRKENRIKYVFIHGIYLLNLASSNPFIQEKSFRTFEKTVALQIQLQTDGLIFHPGSYKGTSRKNGINNIILAVNRVLKGYPSAKIIFESSAGAGDTIGTGLDDLMILFEKTNKKCGICLDTCHLFASGVDLRSQIETDRFISKFDAKIGLKNLLVIHLNDSAKKLGSNRDLHANIGEGEIGAKALINLTRHPKLKKIPYILETPDLKVKTKQPDYILNIKGRLTDI